MADKENKEEEDDKKRFKNLTETHIEDIEEMFEVIDRDKDGMISYVDLTQLLRWLKFNPTEREMAELKKRHDSQQTNMVNVRLVKDIANEKVMEPDTIEELIEAMKILDKSKDGQILVPELRYAMSKLGDCMDEPAVDDMIKEVDGDNKGFVDIMDFAKCCFAIKEKKSKD